MEPGKNNQQGQQQNEGEGSKSADRHYREGVQKTVESGKVDELAKKAKEAVDGQECDALRQAEKEAKEKGANVPRH
jgi:hypothetical protein